MGDFRDIGNSIGNYSRWKRIRWFIIVIVLVIVFINRNNIIQTYNGIQNRVTSFLSGVTSDFENNKKDESITAQLIKEDIGEKELIEISYVDVTSSLTSSKGVEYVGDNLKDGDLATSWQEAKDGFGAGEEITLNFKPNKKVRYIAIYNGKQTSEKEFIQNNRLKEIEIIIEDYATELELDDTMTPQILEISGIDKVNNIVIKIISVYEGTKYDDTVISEIKCY